MSRIPLWKLAAAARLLMGTVALTAILVLVSGEPLAALPPPTPQTQSDQNNSSSSPLGFADVAQRVTPAVVSISAKLEAKAAQDEDDAVTAPPTPDVPDTLEGNRLNDLLQQFRKGMPGSQAQQPPEPILSQGTGFFVSPDGYIVTSKHVIEKAKEISATLQNGDKLPAARVGVDPRTDIALLKVTAEGRTFPYVAFADKDARVGDWVLAVGNAFGLGGSVTAGIVSGQHRNIGVDPYDYMQIDAAVNQGNSGGPAFNLEGTVAGMNTAILTPNGANSGVAFALPASLVKGVVEELKAHGTVDRGWMGIVIQDVNEDIAETLGLPEAKGAMVAEVPADGPAAKQDIKPGDVITEVNGIKVEDARDLSRKTAELHAHTTIKLSIIRNTEKREVELTLGEFPNDQS
jgi:serine protease Do